jgi:hypothetical protein
VTTEARVERAREAARRVVAHDEAHVQAETAERVRLELGVLDHCSPERPGIRDDDPDFHRGTNYALPGKLATMRLAIPVLGAALALGLTACSEDSPSQRAERPKPEPAPPQLEVVRDLAARVPAGSMVALRARPGHRVVARVGARTEFGSPQTLAVALRKGEWLAVRSPALGNDEVGWARASQLRLLKRPVSLEVDLSLRELTVRDPEDGARRISVAIGAPDTSTPTGNFYVTDKLAGSDFGPSYGCCILALSGRQPNLPEGWSGGDRLAIHGSPTPTWGQAVSNGCLHADEDDLRELMRIVPLGTSVKIHA